MGNDLSITLSYIIGTISAIAGLIAVFKGDSLIWILFFIATGIWMTLGNLQEINQKLK